MDREQRVAETFVELADTLVDDFDMIEFLQVLAARCVELLGVSAAGIMLAGQGGSPVTVAASDEDRNASLVIKAIAHATGQTNLKADTEYRNG